MRARVEAQPRISDRDGLVAGESPGEVDDGAGNRRHRNAEDVRDLAVVPVRGVSVKTCRHATTAAGRSGDVNAAQRNIPHVDAVQRCRRDVADRLIRVQGGTDVSRMHAVTLHGAERIEVLAPQIQSVSDVGELTRPQRPPDAVLGHARRDERFPGESPWFVHERILPPEERRAAAKIVLLPNLWMKCVPVDNFRTSAESRASRRAPRPCGHPSVRRATSPPAPGGSESSRPTR